MFSPKSFAHDLSPEISFSKLIYNPIECPGVWSLLEPKGIQNHAPQLCWVREDLLACVWMAGGGEGTAGMSIYLSFLQSGSSYWTAPQLISQDHDRSEQNPLLFISNGSLHLIHSAQQVRNPDDTSWQTDGIPFSMQWTACLRHQTINIHSIQSDLPSSWNALAWSLVDDLLASHAFCRHPPYPSSGGNFLLPIYRSLEAGGSFGNDYSEVLLIDQDGLPLAEPFSVPNSIGRVHGSIVISSDGDHLLQFFRSRLADCIYRSISPDHGASWSEPEPIQLPNNNSSIQVIRLSSGKLAMIYNRFGIHEDPSATKYWGDANWPRTRWPLSIALSINDGDTWPWIRDIDTGFGYQGSMNWTLNGQLAYPTILEGQAGELHIAYSWAGREAIRYLCLREEDIIGYTP
ncbi:exo-alpha-sialidase [Prochlorococcus marinus]|uniref:exo-alpha-sialidase n=1 Tax=Prochlorococcus marinus TaxID=1219 RepID=UPI0007B37810|nr:exo-alpha-sialidase [Prochlorococcus marinus]KZR73248.1 hypothetical protein PMIT1320_01839 [Prochlorococcus marinus str. MIT 1320]